MSSPSRQEPILAGEDLPEDVEPLLLTNLVREGLPPPLWHGSRSPSEQQVEGDRRPSASPGQEPVRPQADALADERTEPLPAHTPSSSGFAAGSTTERAVAAQAGIEAETPDHGVHEHYGTPAEAPAMRTDTAKEPASESEPAVGDHRGRGGASMEEADLAEALERIRNLSFHYGAAPADEAAAGPDAQTPPGQAAGPVLDMHFLQEFEALLFQEVERRVLGELEERLTQHLQKVWKEQVSIAVLRALSLEGIRLRESIRKELQESLPKILQQVLHEGFDQALQPEIAEEQKQGHVE